MNIIMFSGYIGSGKSAAARILNQRIPDSKVISFAERIKDGTAEFYNIQRSLCDTQEGKATFLPNHNKTVRELILDYSAYMKATHGPLIWIDMTIKLIKNNPTITTWLIDDWRYINELTTLKAAFPTAKITTVRITRQAVKPLDFESEHALDDHTMDITIENNGSIVELTDALITLITH